MTYHADQTNKPGTIQSWFYATAPAGTQIDIEADDAFTIYPLRDTETGLPATISSSTPTPGAPSATFTPANAAGTVISASRTKYFYTLRNEGAAGYFKASGFTNVEKFRISRDKYVIPENEAYTLIVSGKAHSDYLCDWEGEKGVSATCDADWVTVTLDSSGASYTVTENTTGAKRFAVIEFDAYSGSTPKPSLQIEQLPAGDTAETWTKTGTTKTRTPDAGTVCVRFEWVGKAPGTVPWTGGLVYYRYRHVYRQIYTVREYDVYTSNLGNTKTVPNGNSYRETDTALSYGATIGGSHYFPQNKSGSTFTVANDGTCTLVITQNSYTGGGGGGNGGNDDNGNTGGGTGGGTGGNVPDPGDTETPPGDGNGNTSGTSGPIDGETVPDDGGTGPGEYGGQNGDTHILTISPTKANAEARAGGVCVQLFVDGIENPLGWPEGVSIEHAQSSVFWMGAGTCTHTHVRESAHSDISWNENPNTLERKGSVIFKLNTGATASFSLTQAAGVFDEAKSFYAVPEKLTFPAEGGTLAAKLSNAELHGGVKWVGVNYNSFLKATDAGKITCEANPLTTRRTDAVQFTCTDGAFAVVNVEQLAQGEELPGTDSGDGGSGSAGDGSTAIGDGDVVIDNQNQAGGATGTPFVSALPGALVVGSSGGEVSFNVYSNTSWTVDVPDWLSPSRISGSGSATVTFFAEENTEATERAGTLDIGSTFTEPQTLSITQAAAGTDGPAAEIPAYFSVAPLQIPAGADGLVAKILVSANCSWTVSASQAWIGLGQAVADASGFESVAVTVSANGEVSARAGEIVFSYGDGETLSVPVTQSAAAPARYLATAFPHGTLDHAGGNIEIPVSSNCSWETRIADGADWITLSQATGTGDASPWVSATENPGTEARTARIEFLVPAADGEAPGIVAATFTLTQTAATETGTPTLYVEAGQEQIGFGMRGIPLEATFSGVSADEVSLAFDATTAAFVSATLVAETATSKTWSLVFDENKDTFPRTALLTVTAGTLAGPVVIEQAAKPRRAVAFYRNKRLWNPAFF